MNDLGESLVSAMLPLDLLVSALKESVDKLETARTELCRGVVRGVDIGDAIGCVEKEIEARSCLSRRVEAYKREALQDLYACVYEGLDAIAQRVSAVLPCGSLEHLDEADVSDDAKMEEALRKGVYLSLFGGLTEQDNSPSDSGVSDSSGSDSSEYGGHYLRYPDLAKGERTPKHLQEIFLLFAKARKQEASKIEVLDVIMERLEISCEAGYPLAKAIKSLASQRLTMAQRAKQTDDALVASVADIQSRIQSKVEGWSSNVLEGSYASIGEYLDC